jgi:hypothetical protein
MIEPRVRLCTESDVRAVLSRDGSVIGIDTMLRQMHSGPAFAADVEGIVLGCAGIVLPWPGVGMAWMCLAKEAGRYGLWLTRTTSRILHDLIRVHQLHRVEVIALEESARNLAWLKILGFTPEHDGRAQAYFTDRRVIRFERIERNP